MSLARLVVPGNQRIITPFSHESLMSKGLQEIDTGLGSNTWDTANKVGYYPFELAEPFTVFKVFTYNGTVVSGNWDLGVMDEAGARLFSSGSTAQATTSDLQPVDITDYTLGEGRYFLAFGLDNATATTVRANPTAAWMDFLGCKEQASAFPIPSTATFAAYTLGDVPLVGLIGVSTF